jgi:NitT/TauT family transport system substrate-binding protein
VQLRQCPATGADFRTSGAAASRRWLATLLVVLPLVACQPNAPAPPPAAAPIAPTAAPTAPATAPAAAAPSPPRETVRVGKLNTIPDAPFFIGEERGYYPDEGIALEYTAFDSAQQAIAPLGAGQLDVGGGAPGPGLINAYQRGVAVRVVADRSRSAPGTYVTCIAVRQPLLASGGLRTFADLRGRVFAENVPNNLMTYVLETELRKAGVSPQELTYTVVPFPDMPPAFANGAIDVAIVLEPFLTLGESRGDFSCWQNIADLVPDLQNGVLLYSPQFAAEREDVARRFMVGYLRAARDYYRAFFGDGTGRVDLIPLLTRNTAIKDADLLARMAPNGMDPDGRVNVDSLRDTQRWYVERGNLAAEADLNQIVDQHFVDYALSRLGPYPR